MSWTDSRLLHVRAGPAQYAAQAANRGRRRKEIEADLRAMQDG